MSHQFKVGDSVVLKPNQKDVDTGTDISGWQARVKEVQPRAIASYYVKQGY